MFTDTAKKPLQIIANDSTIYFPLLAVCSSSPRVKVFPILETEALLWPLPFAYWLILILCRVL